MASGGLNWFQAFEPLAEHFRVVAIDHRGHGRGHPLAGAGSGWPTAPTTPPRCSTCSASTRPSPSATRWAGRSPSCCGTATPRRSPGLVLLRHLEPLRARRPGAAGVRHRGVGDRRLHPGRPARHADPARPLWQRQIPTARAGPARQLRRLGRRPRCAATTPAWSPRPLAAIVQLRQPQVAQRGRRAHHVVVTTNDRAVPPQEQLRLLLAIPHAQVHLHDEGHTWCAKPQLRPGRGRRLPHGRTRLTAGTCRREPSTGPLLERVLVLMDRQELPCTSRTRPSRKRSARSCAPTSPS